MPYLQLIVDIDDGDPDVAEAVCVAHGALAITLEDGGDHPVLEPAPGATPLWPRVRLSALYEAGTDAQALLHDLARDLGLPTGRLRCAPLADRVWEREWLKDFRPMRFGRRLWICPDGQAAPDPHALVLELDPGLAFGTGTHPTTAMCLEWLDTVDVERKTVLDYGCGSGVLALGALRLGAAAACAVDIDPQALLATRQNAGRNGLDSRLTVVSADALPERAWDIVLANILAGPLVELAPRLAQATLPDGAIALAGLLDLQAADVAAAYRTWFDMREFAARDEWTVLTGRRRRE